MPEFDHLGGMMLPEDGNSRCWGAEWLNSPMRLRVCASVAWARSLASIRMSKAGKVGSTSPPEKHWSEASGVGPNHTLGDISEALDMAHISCRSARTNGY